MSYTLPGALSELSTQPPHRLQSRAMNPWNPWQPPGFYNQPHPNAFAGPPGGFPGFWGQPGWAPPNANAGFRSTKYPSLNPILASDTTPIKYDVRRKARSEIPQALYGQYRAMFATASSSAHIRLLSKAFPWSIEIMSSTPITCEAVWDALHTALQEHIVDSEWGIVIGDKRLRETIEKAAKKRVEAEHDDDSRLKRIDWLGAQTIFKGLDRLEDFQELRLLPGADECAETWIVKLGTS
ncbi:hypothetical protein DFH07DRAFT_18094 [Mycena maculata]|uniref:DUF6699 domain-containing protein n=1 Tax=Mycena maculata TaxID=230809 RepID=A0AAD7N5N1_9AGAR|nr:hypothetical protein DFH07DRAFT_18094 [Mycena maculata]